MIAFVFRWFGGTSLIAFHSQDVSDPNVHLFKFSFTPPPHPNAYILKCVTFVSSQFLTVFKTYLTSPLLLAAKAKNKHNHRVPKPDAPSVNSLLKFSPPTFPLASGRPLAAWQVRFSCSYHSHICQVSAIVPAAKPNRWKMSKEFLRIFSSLFQPHLLHSFWGVSFLSRSCLSHRFPPLCPDIERRPLLPGVQSLPWHTFGRLYGEMEQARSGAGVRFQNTTTQCQGWLSSLGVTLARCVVQAYLDFLGSTSHRVQWGLSTRRAVCIEWQLSFHTTF